MKKAADLEFMNKVLENYKNLLMKIQKECGIIENETNYVKGIVAKGSASDSHLIRGVVNTIRERNNSKAGVEKDLMNLVCNYDVASDKLVEMLDRERNSKIIMERRIDSLESDLSNMNLSIKKEAPVVVANNPYEMPELTETERSEADSDKQDAFMKQ